MVSRLRAARKHPACCILIITLLAAAVVLADRQAAANTPVASAFENLTRVADATIRQLEQAANQAKKDLEQIDKKMVEKVDQAPTTDGKVDAINDRLEDKTGVDKDRIPGPNAKPEEFKDFIDRQPLFGDYIEKALKLRALLQAIEAWKKLRAAWAAAYKDITGRELALAPRRAPNVCTEQEFAYSTAAVSTTLAGLVPRTDIAGLPSGPIALAQRRLTIVGGYDVGGSADPYGIAKLSFDPGRLMTGDGLKTALAGVPATPTRDFAFSVNYKPSFKIDLGYSGFSPAGGDSAIGVMNECPPIKENVEVLRPPGPALYGSNALGGVVNLTLKADCHRTANVDALSPPPSFTFQKAALRGGYACPPDRATQQRLMLDWQGALAGQGIHVDAASGRNFYLGTNVGMGYCIAEWDDYRVDQNRCAASLSNLKFPSWEIAQPREGLPAVVGHVKHGGLQLAQAAPAARGAARPVAALPNDRYFHAKGTLRAGLDDQWGLKRIGFAAAPPDGTGSLWPKAATPVLVAVVDSGVDASHPELAGALWANPKELPGNGKDDDGNGYVDDVFGWNFINNTNNTWDNNGHGTFVAGIIAARTHDVVGIAGVNPWARILPVKVTDFNNKGDHLYLAHGIYYAADMGARVINVSIGGKRLTLAEQYAIDYAVKKGALVVAAAGNDGIDIADFSPAGVNGVITVAATDENDGRAAFSNFGGKVDIAAPGVDILSLRARQTDLMALYDKTYAPGANFVGEDRMYYRLSGTSFAAPFVAGVASLIFSIDPSLKPEQVKRMILQSARDLEVPGHDQFTGYGLLDARAALAADPNRYVDARITGVGLFRQDGRPVLVPTGTAAADRMKRAWLEVGKGKQPSAWTRASEDMTKPVENGQLAPMPVRHFPGPGDYVLRLVVEHADGATREARHELNLR